MVSQMWEIMKRIGDPEARTPQDVFITVKFLIIRELSRPTETRFVEWSKEVERAINELTARTECLREMLEVRDSEEAARQLIKEEDPCDKKVKG